MGVLYNRFLPIDPPYEEPAAAPALKIQDQQHRSSSTTTTTTSSSSSNTMAATPATPYHAGAPELLIYHNCHHEHEHEHGRSNYDGGDDWWNAPDTPEPAEPFLKTATNGGNYDDERQKITSSAAAEEHSAALDGGVVAAEDTNAESEDDESGLFDATTADKLRGAAVAFSDSPSVVWAVNALYILLGGSVLGATVIVHTLQGFGGIFEPSALLLWQSVGWVLAAVRSATNWFFGTLFQWWRYIRAPPDNLEFPVEAPSDPTIYDQETVRRLLMTMNYQDTDEEYDNAKHYEGSLCSTIKADVWGPFRDYCKSVWKDE